MLADHFGDLGLKLGRPIVVRKNSKIFKATIEATPSVECAVKICFLPGTQLLDKISAKAQFRALERVAYALMEHDAQHAVPKPLYLLPELGTYVMEWVEGKSLTKKMQRPLTLLGASGEFERAGTWLGAFHSAGPLRHQTVDLSHRLAVLDEVSGAALPVEIFLNAVSLLKRSAPGLAGRDVANSWLHGDCKSDNFILTRESIYGVDIALIYENPIEFDIAMFLNHLGRLTLHPRYLYLLPLRKHFEQSFWRGYLRTGPAVSVPYLNWLRLEFLLSSWHTELHGHHPNFRSKVLNETFSILAWRLSNDLEMQEAT
ncbi:Phosphotransferase enzyme family protein [Polaromonas sp. OV174]|nr:Phosphotransferase enzyme family protein [Polaromonas sp. OV174]